MNVIVVFGWKESEAGPQPEVLYCGLDGVEANAAAEKARQTGDFVKIGRVRNPSIVPMGHVPDSKPAEAAVADSKSEPKKKKN